MGPLKKIGLIVFLLCSNSLISGKNDHLNIGNLGPLIRGGTDTTLEEHPWLVALIAVPKKYVDRKRSFDCSARKLACGAVLIHTIGVEGGGTRPKKGGEIEISKNRDVVRVITRLRIVRFYKISAP